MVIYCNSLNETFNPRVIDCTSINLNCCYAKYTVLQYGFTTCFYNEKMDNTQANSFFEDTIGSISSSPLMTYKVECKSRFLYLHYKMIVFSVILICELIIFNTIF